MGGSGRISLSPCPRRASRHLAAAGSAAVVLAGLAAPAAGQHPSGLPPALLAQHIAAPSICEPIEDLVHGDEWSIHPLTNDFTLYMVPCAAGAYNFSFTLYVGYVGSEFFSRLLFADFNDRYGWTGVDQLYGAVFVDETLTLTSYYKGRGLADCGTAGVWVWDEYGFKMLAFFAKSECDGLGEPGDFPQVWPAG